MGRVSTEECEDYPSDEPEEVDPAEREAEARGEYLSELKEAGR